MDLRRPKNSLRRGPTSGGATKPRTVGYVRDDYPEPRGGSRAGKAREQTLSKAYPGGVSDHMLLKASAVPTQRSFLRTD